LEGEVNLLFQWLNEHCTDDWDVDVLGVCPTEGNLILNTIFQSEKDFKLFQKDFINDQSRYASVYNNRRKPGYKWPVSAERRDNTDRRSDKYRRNPKRNESRRLEDIVKRVLMRKKSAPVDDASDTNGNSTIAQATQ
jgi:hypothetical protein